MIDIEQILRENRPELPEEGQFLIETNARLAKVEGIKRSIDKERRHSRAALLAALAAGVVIGCAVTLFMIFCPLPSVKMDPSYFEKILALLYKWKYQIAAFTAVCTIIPGILLMTRRRGVL